MPRRAATLARAEWIDFLLRSIGLEPSAFNERAKRVVLLRMIPFVERNYNLVELGPRGTGKSHLFQQISPYAHLISGGKATVAKMFVNNASGQRGLVCQYDVVCFDEVSGISFDQKDGVNIMKGYMASGQFSRGKENIRAEGSIVMVGNLDVDVEQQQKIGHLLSPMPPEMRDDTAFMDRIHAYAPGWDYPKLKPSEHLTDHFGLVSDFLSECWSRLRTGNRMSVHAILGIGRRPQPPRGRILTSDPPMDAEKLQLVLRRPGPSCIVRGSSWTKHTRRRHCRRRTEPRRVDRDDSERYPDRRACIHKQAQTLLMPVWARRQRNDSPDELWTKISIEFYKDGARRGFQALLE